MKTIVIWDLCGEGPLQYFVVKHDVTHLDGTYINSTKCPEANQDELGSLIFDDLWREKIKMYHKFPMKSVREPDSKVIVCGFLP